MRKLRICPDVRGRDKSRPYKVSRAVHLRGLFLFLLLFYCASSLAAEVEVFRETKRDRSEELRKIPPKPLAAGVKRVVPNVEVTGDSGTDVMATGDPVIQTWSGAESMPDPILNFEGISAHGHIPPDTCGEAGINHYVQMVNRQFAVFDKGGTIVYGPVDTNTLWTGFGGICETTNQGDPIVIYDQIANRWILTQFANTGPGSHRECVAISATSDPTGRYYRYEFTFPFFNDYPKIGVWPDGYYSTYILRKPPFAVVGGRICAFNRKKMLAGASTSVQCFDVGKANIGLLPADLDGKKRPPKGSPHFSLKLSKTSLDLWKLKINWKKPAQSILSGPIQIPVASYVRGCASAGGRACIPQPGVKQKLGVFSDRLMFRLSYRNFGSHQSLMTNHTVQAGRGISAVRWYEIRDPGNAPTLFQQGTYAPDSHHRWMGSIAADRSGNIAVGYSTSSKQLHPGIRYTGRLFTDPPNTLPQGESVIINGSGSQTGATRWGDYSAMSIDPVDDCTFWYTTEYIADTGSFNWRTRIASFKFPSCGVQQ